MMASTASTQGQTAPNRRILPWSRQERHRGPWDVLLSGKADADTAFSSLSSLWANRTSLRTLSPQQARALVSALAASSPWKLTEPVRAGVAHLALGLLARCALGMRTPVSQGQPTPLQQEVRQGMVTLLRLLQDHRQLQQQQGQAATAVIWVPPLVAAGALLLIGAAYPLCDGPSRRTCTQAAADLLLLPGLLGDLDAAEDACAGAGLLLENLASEDPDSSARLATCLLSAAAALVTQVSPLSPVLADLEASHMQGGETALLMQQLHLRCQAQAVMAVCWQVGAVFKQLGTAIASQLAAGEGPSSGTTSAPPRAASNRPQDRAAAAAAQARQAALRLQALQRVAALLEQGVMGWVSGSLPPLLPQRATVVLPPAPAPQQQQPLLAAMATVTALVTTPLLAGIGMGLSSRSMAPSNTSSTSLATAAAQHAMGGCCLIAASALLEGMQDASAAAAASARKSQRPSQQQQQQPQQANRQHQALHTVAAQLAASIQVGLAHAAIQYTGRGPHSGSQAGAQAAIMRVASQPGHGPGAVSDLVCLWASGLVYARLVCSPSLAPCLPHALPPGPAAAPLPLLATCTLLDCALGMDTLAIHAVIAGAPPPSAARIPPVSSTQTSASPGAQHAASNAAAGNTPAVSLASSQATAALQAANEYLQRHCGAGGGMYQEVSLLGRCLVQSLLQGGSSGSVVPGQGPPAPNSSTGAHPPPFQQSHSPSYPAANTMPEPVVHPSQYALLEALHQGAVQAGALYSLIALHAPPGWVEGLNPELLRGLLDRIYVSIATPLAMLVQTQQAAASRQPGPQHPGSGALAHAAQESGAASREPEAAASSHGVSTAAEGASGMSAAVSAAGAGTALMLMCLAELSFCRVHLPLFNTLAEQLVTGTLASPLAAAALLTHLPCYDALLQPVAATGLRGASHQHHQSCQHPSHRESHHASQEPSPPRWKADPVLAAKLAFLLPTAAACVAHVEEPAACAEALMPTLFLLLRHPQPGVSSVAHTAFGTIINTLLQPASSSLLIPPPPASARTGHHDSAGAHLAHQQEPQWQVRVAVATHALPYYVERSLQLPWDYDQLAGFESGLTMALSALPPGSLNALAAMEYVLEAGVAWLQAHVTSNGLHGHSDSSSNDGSGSAPGPLPYLDFKALREYAAGKNMHGRLDVPAVNDMHQQHLSGAPDLGATQLLSTCCSLVLRADWQLLPAVLRLEERLLQVAAECSAVAARQHAQAERAARSASTSPTPAVPAAPGRWSFNASWLRGWWSGRDGTSSHLDAKGYPHQGEPHDPLSQLLQHLHDMIIGSDDYVRKGLLVKWLQGLLATSSSHSNRQQPNSERQHQHEQGAGAARAWQRLGLMAHHIVPHPQITGGDGNCRNPGLHGMSIACAFE